MKKRIQLLHERENVIDPRAALHFHDGRRTQRRKENKAASTRSRTASGVIRRLTYKLSGGWSTEIGKLVEIAPTAAELAVFTDLDFVGHLAHRAATTVASDDPADDARLLDLVLGDKCLALARVHTSSNDAADDT